MLSLPQLRCTGSLAVVDVFGDLPVCVCVGVCVCLMIYLCVCVGVSRVMVYWYEVDCAQAGAAPVETLWFVVWGGTQPSAAVWA